MAALVVQTAERKGEVISLRSFPWNVGRGAANHSCFAQPGVWEEHLRFTFERGDGYWVRALAPATLLVNGAVLQESRLRPGDVVEMGSVRFLFVLAQVPQRGLGWREWCVWIGMAALSLAQIGLVYLLL